jgi:hypothetical protein
MGDQARNQGMDSQAGSFIGEGGAEQSGSLRQFLYFLMHHKKWWLTLVIIVLLLLALLIVLGGSAAAPLSSTRCFEIPGFCGTPFGNVGGGRAGRRRF